MSSHIVVGRLQRLCRKPPQHRFILNLITARLAVPAAAVALASSVAVAADMPMKDMPMKAAAAPAYQWSGCYVGLNGGGGATGSNVTTMVGAGGT